MNIPAQVRQGDSLQWKDCPTFDNMRNPISAADGWTLHYAIRGAVALDLDSDVDGQDWLMTMIVTDTQTLTPGDYYWQAYAEKNDERVTLGSGKLVVLADMSQQTTGADNRSQIKKDLDAVQAAMRAVISGGAVQKYVIANRQVEKMSMADLIMLESKLKVEYAREQKAQQMANGQGNPNNVFVRFR